MTHNHARAATPRRAANTKRAAQRFPGNRRERAQEVGRTLLLSVFSPQLLVEEERSWTTRRLAGQR